MNSKKDVDESDWKPGTTIQTTAAELISLAKFSGALAFGMFNGHLIHANSSSTIDEIVADYRGKLLMSMKGTAFIRAIFVPEFPSLAPKGLFEGRIFDIARLFLCDELVRMEVHAGGEVWVWNNWIESEED